MNQDNDFPRYGQQGPQQYGLSSFDRVPRGKRGLVEKIFGPDIAERFSSPLFSTAVFVVAAAALGGIILAAYPSADEEPEIPVVQADTFAYKETPTEPGGMTIPNRDSTIFSAMNDENAAEPAPIENLLADDGAEEPPADRLAAFAREVEASMDEPQAPAEEAAEDASPDMPADLISPMAAAEAPDEEAPAAEATETEPVTFQKIAQKPAEEEEARPPIVHKAGENPETLDFVRSVLDKKDAGDAATTTASASDVATGAASIQPSAGTAGPADFAIAPGDYYVQLASVKTPDGAVGEWAKLQEAFEAELGRAPHRVQTADLGERGMFYRIQAGPMSKDSAVKICESIKSQKPGGCLVTQ